MEPDWLVFEEPFDVGVGVVQSLHQQDDPDDDHDPDPGGPGLVRGAVLQGIRLDDRLHLRLHHRIEVLLGEDGGLAGRRSGGSRGCRWRERGRRIRLGAGRGRGRRGLGLGTCRRGGLLGRLRGRRRGIRLRGSGRLGLGLRCGFLGGCGSGVGGRLGASGRLHAVRTVPRLVLRQLLRVVAELGGHGGGVVVARPLSIGSIAEDADEQDDEGEHQDVLHDGLLNCCRSSGPSRPLSRKEGTCEQAPPHPNLGLGTHYSQITLYEMLIVKDQTNLDEVTM